MQSMPSLPEEFLLITLADAGGAFCQMEAEARQAAFAGAALMDLALRDRIDSDLNGVWLTSSEPTGEPTLDPVLAGMARDGSTASTSELLEKVLRMAGDIRASALSHLCDIGILKQVEDRVLWIFPTRRYPVVDGRELREAKLRLLDVLIGNAVPDARDVCLLALVETTGLLRQIVAKPDLARAEQRIAEVSRLDLIALEMRAHVDRFRALQREAIGLASVIR